MKKAVRHAGDPVTETPAPSTLPQTGRQVAWNYLVFALSKSSTLIMTVVLARLLTPADFGLFALALLVVNLFDYVKDLGVGAALVQSQKQWNRLAPTGMTLTVVFGLLAGAMLACAAPLIAATLHHSDLTPLVRVLAIALVISALSAVPAARLRRYLDFRRRLLPEFAGALAKTVLAITLAANGFGVWSLVYGQMAAAVLTTALYWWAARSRISFGLDRDEARTLIGFGLPVTAVTLLAFAIYNVDYLAIGIRLGDEQLGLYTLAYRLPELVILNLCVVVSEVLFSALSRLQQDRSQLVTHYLQAVVAVMALTTPVGVALAIAAPAVIETLYGPSYSAAAPALTLLSVYAVVYSASFHAGDVFKAINKPSILTAISALKLILMIGPIWWAAGRSIVLVATALVLVECVQFAVRMVIVSKVAAVPATRLLKSILRPAPAAAGMAAVMVLVEHISVSMPGPAVLAVTVSAGLLAYVAGLWLTAPQLVGGALAGLRSLRDRHSAEASTQPFAVPPSSRAVGADRCWVQRKRWP